MPARMTEADLRRAGITPPTTPKRKRTKKPPAAINWQAFGLPEPVAEYQFHPTRKWRLDFYWHDAKVALEVDGGVWSKGRHTRGYGFIEDQRKRNAAAQMGIRVFHCTPQEIKSGAIFTTLREILG